jgi:hypothetical protein
LVGRRIDGTDDTTCTERVPVAFGTTQGARLPIWTTPTGEYTDPPASAVEVGSMAILAGTGLVLGTGAAAALLFATTRKVVDRHRYRIGDVDWATFDRSRNRF